VLDVPAQRSPCLLRGHVGRIDLQHLVVTATQNRHAAVTIELQLAAQTRERRQVVALLAVGIAEQDLGPGSATREYVRDVYPLREDVDAEPTGVAPGGAKEPHFLGPLRLNAAKLA